MFFGIFNIIINIVKVFLHQVLIRLGFDSNLEKNRLIDRLPPKFVLLIKGAVNPKGR